MRHPWAGSVVEAMEPDDPAFIDEADWIKHRIWRLLRLRRLVDDARALTAIDDLIAEAEARLYRLQEEEHRALSRR